MIDLIQRSLHSLCSVEMVLDCIKFIAKGFLILIILNKFLILLIETLIIKSIKITHLNFYFQDGLFYLILFF